MKVICVNNISIVGNESIPEALTIGKFYTVYKTPDHIINKYLICNDLGLYIFYKKSENFFLTEKENRKKKLQKIGNFLY